MLYGFGLPHLNGAAWRLPAWHRTKMLKAKKGEVFQKPMMPLCKERKTLPLHGDQARPGAHTPGFLFCLCHNGLVASGKLPTSPSLRAFARGAAVNLKRYQAVNGLVEQKQVSRGVVSSVENQGEATHECMHTNAHLLPSAETKRGPTLVRCICSSTAPVCSGTEKSRATFPSAGLPAKAWQRKEGRVPWEGALISQYVGLDLGKILTCQLLVSGLWQPSPLCWSAV